jgi:uncharacterized membrane protein
MAARRSRLANVLLGLLLIGYQILAHFITAADRLTAFGVAVMIVPVAGGAFWALWVELGARIAWAALAAALLLSAAGLAWWGLPSAALVYGLPHFSANLFLLWFFARTLRAGREPLVTRIAQRLEGRALPEVMRGYTRRVTIAWSVFFAAQLAASLLLYACASRMVWSLFINIVSSLLIPTMFVAEYGLRRVWHREHARGPVFAGADLFSDPSPSAPIDPR